MQLYSIIYQLSLKIYHSVIVTKVFYYERIPRAANVIIYQIYQNYPIIKHLEHAKIHFRYFLIFAFRLSIVEGLY